MIHEHKKTASTLPVSLESDKCVPPQVFTYLIIFYLSKLEKKIKKDLKQTSKC